MKGQTITPEQREQVLLFSRVGMLQKNIAVEMGLHRDSIRKIQTQCNLRPHSTEPLPSEAEEKISKLLAAGHGEPKIAEQLGLPRHRVRQTMKKLGYVRPRGSIGHKYLLADAKLREIRRAIRISERKIAAEFGVSRTWLSKFRRRIWNNAGDNNWKRRHERAK